jgi:hypothetical protein
MADSPGVLIETGGSAARPYRGGAGSAPARRPSGPAYRRPAPDGRRPAPVERGPARQRAQLIGALLLALVVAGTVVQAARLAQRPPVAGSGQYDTTAAMGVCPTTIRCVVVPKVGTGMLAATAASFPTMRIVSASALQDAATGVLYTQRIALVQGPTHVILWLTQLPHAAAQEMQYQTIEVAQRIVVTAWPADGSTLVGATVMLFGAPPRELPVAAAGDWVRSPGLFA